MKILRFLNNKLEEIFLVVLMILATLTVTAQVVTRYLLKIPLPWSEELARYMFIWLVWVGASFATKERRHISIDVLVKRLPDSAQKICTIISTLVWIAFLLCMSYLSFKLTRSVFGGSQVAVGSGIPMWIPYAAIPTGMILMLFRLLQNCYYDLKRAGSSKKEGTL